MTIKPGYPVYYSGHRVGVTSDGRKKIFDNIVNLKAELVVKEVEGSKTHLLVRILELLGAIIVLIILANIK